MTSQKSPQAVTKEAPRLVNYSEQATQEQATRSIQPRASNPGAGNQEHSPISAATRDVLFVESPPKFALTTMAPSGSSRYFPAIYKTQGKACSMWLHVL